MVQIRVKNMNIITTKDNFGGELIYTKIGLGKGRNELKKLGFEQQRNPQYFKKGNEYWHWNGTLKVWIYEKVNENKSTVFTGEY